MTPVEFSAMGSPKAPTRRKRASGFVGQLVMLSSAFLLALRQQIVCSWPLAFEQSHRGPNGIGGNRVYDDHSLPDLPFQPGLRHDAHSFTNLLWNYCLSAC
jgi:hypothetical protein